jgi:hypothetical protein
VHVSSPGCCVRRAKDYRQEGIPHICTLFPARDFSLTQ